MAIANSSIAIDSTASVTGGTARTVKELVRNNSELNAYIDEGLSFQARKEVAFSVKVPKVSVSAPGGFTQARSTVILKSPKTLANGNRTVNTVSIQLSVDPETTAAEVTTMLNAAAQLLFDSDYSDFWKAQALA
ncbi:coat protein [ssRNA phage ESE017]|uniref:Coat protein n=2 Tax=ssRNA phage ESE017 TaxID=2786000 RepID=A0A8S5KXW9_9VIRU|nr:coat protein [ssRNA phage ESE017]DAD49893.1 TPA_asm: coat protein [ssRNA phage ESE017]